MQGKFIIDDQVIRHIPQAGALLQRLCQADVFVGTVVIFAEGMPAQIHAGVLIDVQEGLQSAAMIIMAVRKYGDIDFLQINPQRLRIAGKGVALAHVK